MSGLELVRVKGIFSKAFFFEREVNCLHERALTNKILVRNVERCL